MRLLIIFFYLLIPTLCLAEQNHLTNKSLKPIEKRLFVSFSMPQKLLTQSFEAAERSHVTVVFNGLIDNSMPKTAIFLSKLGKLYPTLSIQIDPVAFEDFKIDAVPALVVSLGKDFDVVSGNIALSDALSLINERGDLKEKML